MAYWDLLRQNWADRRGFLNRCSALLSQGLLLDSYCPRQARLGEQSMIVELEILVTAADRCSTYL
jgi:hypothetical protein